MEINNLDVSVIINYYSKKGIYISILPDGYELQEVGICWRGYVYWKLNDKWVNEDCGCFSEWDKSFISVIKFINDFLLKV